MEKNHGKCNFFRNGGQSRFGIFFFFFIVRFGARLFFQWRWQFNEKERIHLPIMNCERIEQSGSLGPRFAYLRSKGFSRNARISRGSENTIERAEYIFNSRLYCSLERAPRTHTLGTLVNSCGVGNGWECVVHSRKSGLRIYLASVKMKSRISTSFLHFFANSTFSAI